MKVCRYSGRAPWRPAWMAVLALVVTMFALADSAAAQTSISQTSTTVFPIKLSKTGSYILKSNLDVSAATTDALDVSASSVTINLNGFTISGPGSSTGGTGVNATSGADLSTFTVVMCRGGPLG
jgi:hypothetical protein